MDEDELRIAGFEKALLAITPWIEERHLVDAMATLRAELRADACEDERLVTLHAMELIEDGRKRFLPGVAGRLIRGG